MLDGTWLGNYRLEAYLRNPVKIHLKGKSKKVRAICLVKECLPSTSQALNSIPSLREAEAEDMNDWAEAMSQKHLTTAGYFHTQSG